MTSDPTDVSPSPENTPLQPSLFPDDRLDLGFVARSFILGSLPHSATKGNEYTRTNGNFTLSLLAPADVGLPYGVLPRRLLAWITTQAVRTKSTHVDLGTRADKFLAVLGLSSTGGVRGNYSRLRDQLTRLVNTTISCTWSGTAVSPLNPKRRIAGKAGGGFQVASRYQFWWYQDTNETHPDSYLELSREFFDEVSGKPVPIDFGVLKQLDSALEIDLYTWLTYRALRSQHHTQELIPWQALHLQFGGNYARLWDFRRKANIALKSILRLYSEPRLEDTAEGLIVRPYAPHVGRLIGR